MGSNLTPRDHVEHGTGVVSYMVSMAGGLRALQPDTMPRDSDHQHGGPSNQLL